MSEYTYLNEIITSQTSNGLAEMFKSYNRSFLNNAGNIIIDKFKLPLTSIPLMIFDIAPNTYTVELTFGAFSSGIVSLHTFFYSYWSGSGMTPQDPRFYYIFTPNHFLDILNQALSDAFVTLSVVPGFPAAQVPPFFHMNPDSHILTLYGSSSYLETAGLNRINFYCNSRLSYQFLNGFTKLGLNSNLLSPLTSGRDTRFLFIDKLIGNITIGTVTLYTQPSESKADTIISWNVSKGIVLTTNLETRKEFFPEGTRGNNNVLASSDILMNFDIQYQDNVRPLLLSYIAPTYDKKIKINYAKAEEIGLKFYWYDKNNKLYPIYIYKDDACTIRMVFHNEK
jgi:hypothetical protein